MARRKLLLKESDETSGIQIFTNYSGMTANILYKGVQLIWEWTLNTPHSQTWWWQHHPLDIVFYRGDREDLM